MAEIVRLTPKGLRTRERIVEAAAKVTYQDDLELRTILAHPEAIGLGIEPFQVALRMRKAAGRIAEDVESADLSGVSGTPSFFINGHRHQDPTTSRL